MWGKREHILYHATDLDRLARNLEKECAKWTLPDYSKPNWDRARTSQSSLRNYKKRTEIIWFNAVEAGVIIFKLCGLGAFDDQHRIKNMVCQISSKVQQDLQKFILTSPQDIGLHTIYSHRTKNSFDVFFVKIFESFCKMSKSHEDSMGFAGHYDNLKVLAKLHSKMMYLLNADLKSRFRDPVENELH